jgi:hypothetical protein
MATGTKETRKVWESLPLEMRGKPKKCAGKKREKTAEAATEAVSTTGKWVERCRKKKKMSEKKERKKKPQQTAAEAKEDSSSSSSRGGLEGFGGVQKGSSDGVWQMGRSEGVVGWFGQMVSGSSSNSSGSVVGWFGQMVSGSSSNSSGSVVGWFGQMVSGSSSNSSGSLVGGFGQAPAAAAAAAAGFQLRQGFSGL